MAERYFPFDSGAGSTVIEDDWFKMARSYSYDGVIYQLSTEITSPYVGPQFNGLKVTAGAGLDASINVGVARIHGGCYENTAAKTVTAGTAPAGGQSRHDLVILRLDRSANTVTAVILAGTAAATGSQVDPTLTKGPVTWEIPLARLLITGGSGTLGTITDYRQWSYIPPDKTWVQIKKTATQTIPNTTDQLVTWNADIGNTTDLFVDANDEFVCVVNGIYEVFWHPQSVAGGAATSGYYNYKLNTVTFAGAQLPIIGQNSYTPAVLRRAFKTGDTLRIHAVVLAGSRDISTSSWAYFEWIKPSG